MTTKFLINQDIGHGEADSFLPFHDQYQHGLDHYLEHLAALKNTLNIPVIASLNGISLNGWVEHGKLLEQAGADALELNVYFLAADFNETSHTVESRYLELLRKLRGQVSIPIAMKLSPYFSALPHFLKRLEEEGANGAVLFNRFYQPDIDPDSLKIIPQLHLSSSIDTLLAMRWIAIVSGRVNLALAASGGIHNAQDAVKMLLAGADILNLCSTLIINGPEQLSKIKSNLQDWMEQNEFSSVSELRGRLSQQFCDNPEAFERANYVSMVS